MRKTAAACVAAAIAAALPAPAPAQPLEAAQRVVSIGVCADQLLLALADPLQIASLSADSTNPAISFYFELAAGYPRGTGMEAIVGYAPDLVLADETTPEATRAMVERLGVRLVTLSPVTSIDAAIAEVREVAALLGRETQGETLVSLIEAARRQAVRTNWGATVVSFRRGGFVPGDDTLVADLLSVIGLNNVGEALSRGDGRVPLEVLVADPPTYLVVPGPEASPVGGALAMLDHPALARLYPPAQRIRLPDRLTYCGGPSLPDALRILAQELARVTP